MAPQQNTDRILTTHVGSLARPARLLDYVTAIERGVAVNEGAFETDLKGAVAQVVEQQAQAGVDIVSDGEFGKFRTWSAYVLERLGGIEEREVGPATGTGKDQRTFPEFYAQYFLAQNLPKRGIVAAVGPLTYKGHHAIARDISNLKSALASVNVTAGFVPVVAPASAVPRHQNDFYKNDEEFFFALADALREEYAAVINAGLYLQVDDAFLPYMYDVAFTDQPIENFRKWATLRVDALNHALRGMPEEKIRYHICWGSFNVPHTTDVPLHDIVELVLRVNAGAYCLEMANPRHEHEWRVWERVKLPAGRTLIPGVISHATNIVEHPELVAERIVRLAKLVGRDNVIAGTDCGFAQTPFLTRVHPTIMWAKLAALAEGARIATKELWGR
jgi:5-methyltetrahydropteroyltriglutamate--homocysteine methyltransferase